jgi:hypothetical protein
VRAERNRALTIAILLAVVVAAFATDWPGDVSGSFWGRHSMAGGLLAGLLTLAVGVVLVEWWLQRVYEKRWARIGRISFKELGFAADELRDGAEMLLGGRFPYLYDHPLPQAAHAELERVLVRHQTLESIADTDYAGRLNVLLADAEWASIAVDVLDALKHRHRNVLATWMPVMLTSERLSHVIETVANLNELVYALQEPLRAAARAHRGGRPRHEGWTTAHVHAEAARRWLQFAAATVFVQESLMRRATGDQTWKLDRGRSRLAGQLAELDRAHKDADVAAALLTPADRQSSFTSA